jgi:hypothetical protein
MRSLSRYTATLFATGSACAFVALAPVAAAAPDCVNIGPTTTQCQTNGSAQIVTSPQQTSNWGGWPYWGGGGGLVIGFGGFGW